MRPPTFATPFTPGREFVARVVEPPAGRADLAGARVVASPDLVCGVCDRCRSGLSAHCVDRLLLGTPGADGCLSERLTMPAGNLVPISDALDDDRAVFALPLARALHAAWIVHLEGRPFVTVMGRGVEAVLAAQVMTRLNASVRVVSSCAATLGAADRLGVRHRPLEDVGLRGDQDVIVEVAPTGAGLEVAAAMVRPRGKIVLLRPLDTGAGAGAPDPADLTPIVRNEVTVFGCRGHRLREAVAMLERGEIAVDGLISQRFPFHRADAALRAAADPGLLRVAVDGP